MIRCPKCHRISVQVYPQKMRGYDPKFKKCICMNCDYIGYQIKEDNTQLSNQLKLEEASNG
ncbi:hypothetical protein ES707_07374 [subsurface metagenome]